jgi:hypothetical protein
MTYYKLCTKYKITNIYFQSEGEPHHQTLIAILQHANTQ